MNNIPSVPIGGLKTHAVSPARKLRSDPGFPHISFEEMFHARPALLTVFSITQLEHLIPRCAFMISQILRHVLFYLICVLL